MKNVLFVIALVCLPIVAFAQTPPAWDLTEDEIKSIAYRITAGKDLQPDSWPGGARVAVLLSFDVDNQTYTIAGENPPSIGTMSQGEYGARRGLQRVVDLMDKNAIPASFFIPAVSLVIHPDQVQVIQESGRHEFAVHGWIHERNTSLDGQVEKELVERAVSYLEKVTGTRPVGYRAPSWNFSPNTLNIIRDMGFLYDSSLMADDRPYEINQNGEPSGIIELPVEWILDDAPLVNPLGTRYSSPRDLLSVYKDEFDVAYEEGTMFLLTMHPHIIGHRSRIVILEELIEHIKSKGDVWFATHKQVAEYVNK